MLQTLSPVGTEMQIPESADEDLSYFTLDELDAATEYYRQEGYVVVRGLLDARRCGQVVAAFDDEARFSRLPILRQKNMQYERNAFDENGLLTNPIFNIQDLHPRHFGRFKSAALDLYTDARVTRVASALLGASAHGAGVRLIESMFFEAPAGTWPHQDSYYQDSAERLGGATAAWFALEDIGPKAGRFYVCPRSHSRVPVILNRGDKNFGTGHAHYRDAVLDAALRHGMSWRAPYMGVGDVLFWNSLTIHGSLPQPPGSRASRRSLTGHYLQSTDEMLQFHARVRRQKLTQYKGVQVGLLHDQTEWKNQFVRSFAYRFPRLWTLARRVAIKTLVELRKRQHTPEPVAVALMAGADHKS